MRKLVTSFFIGALSVGMAWAGAGLVPVATNDAPEAADGAPAESIQEPGADEQTVSVPSIDLSTGQVLAGSAKVDMKPTDERWVQDPAQCETDRGPHNQATHVIDPRVKWPEHPNCIYMGGYGVGPLYSITKWTDPYGLYVRSVAIGDEQGDTIVLTLLDGAYYEGHYSSMCKGAPLSAEQDCGFLDLQASLAEELGIDRSGLFFSFTHSHTAPDFIGAWGGVPDWYMDQIENSIRASVRAAVANMRPAAIEVGETPARQFSAERRSFYRAAEDQNLTWFRLIDAGTVQEPVCTTPSPTPIDGNNGNGNGNGFGNQGKTPPPPPEPECTEGSKGTAIATVGAMAAHPVTADADSSVADADFPGVFATAVEDKWGGVGMLLMTGFGNVSPRNGDHPQGESNKERMGYGLASLIPEVGGGQQVTNPDVRSAQTFWTHPVTNSVLAAGGLTGVFDRRMNETPAHIETGENFVRPCVSTSPVSVRTSVSAARIGNFLITAGPGELFSNLTNTIKEKHPDGIAMPLAVTNDGLGYIMQEFESDHAGRQGVGFVGEPERVLAEYEDAYSIDHCIGEATLEHTLQLIGSLK